MKIIVAIFLLFCTTALPALAELTPEDLSQIRLIVKEIVNEAITPVKEDVAWLRGKMDTLDKQIYWLMALIVAAVGIPQIVIAWRSKKDREQEQINKELREKIEMLEQRIVNL